MLRIRSLVVLSCIALLFGCAASPHQVSYEKAQNAYNNGKDDAALKYTLEALKSKPDYKPAVELLSQIYSTVVGGHQDAVTKLRKSSRIPETERWEDIVMHLEKIDDFNREIELITRRNKNLNVKMVRVDKKLPMALDSAAYWNFQYGLDEMDRGSKSAKRRAAVYFSRALEYDRNYPDARKLYEKCRQEGMLRIVVDKLRDDFSGRIDGAIISAIQKDRDASEFISFVSRSDLDRLLDEQSLSLSGDFIEGSGVDMVGQLLDAQFVIVGSVEKADCLKEPEVESFEKEVSAAVKTGRKNCTTSTNSKGVTKKSCTDEYQTVYGTVTTDSLRRKASIAGNVKILDVATGEIKKSIDIRAGVMSTGEKSICRGNENACRNAKIKKEVTLRSCSELGDQLVVDFAKKAVKGIAAYTSRLTN